ARGRTEPGSYPRYFFGNEEKDICRYGNGWDETTKNFPPPRPFAPCNDGYIQTSPVGVFAPNSFGLYDMLGNLWQWTEDCHNANYNRAPTDGSAWLSGNCNMRMFRGGGWIDIPSALRAAQRKPTNPLSRYTVWGMRVGRALNQ